MRGDRFMFRGHFWLIAVILAVMCSPALMAEIGGEAPATEDLHAATDQATEAAHAADAADHSEHGDDHHGPVPSIPTVLPFVALLLCVAILPLNHRTEHWWEKNSSKLTMALILGGITSVYYLMRGYGFHGGDPGLACLLKIYDHAIVADYIPFIVLLFSLYTISGGINLRGDLPAHPMTNTTFLAIGAGLASFIGTTGAAMLLIRPLLQVNSQRKHVKHTVIFFIFLVANVGGSLLPIGDPPLFLGYLRGVSFLWTFGLWPQWLALVIVLLIIYFIWDTIAYRKEDKASITRDETQVEPLRVTGLINIPLLLGVVLAVALLVPGKELFGMKIPPFLREGVQLALAAVSWVVTPKLIRKANSFNFVAIGEVACLFIGIFVTMMPAIEILNAKGASLGLSEPWHYFWATGLLSSFLDNAPTYVVFFETAGAMPIAEGVASLPVMTATGVISVPLLVAISLGAVFMGANTYIGNGPNFMVKSIAEQSGVKMPSFFGYMFYSGVVLLPLFVVVTFVFLW